GRAMSISTVAGRACQAVLCDGGDSLFFIGPIIRPASSALNRAAEAVAAAMETTGDVKEHRQNPAFLLRTHYAPRRQRYRARLRDHWSGDRAPALQVRNRAVQDCRGAK